MKKFFDIELFLIFALGTPAIINTYLNINIRFAVYLVIYIFAFIIFLINKRKYLFIRKIEFKKEYIFLFLLIFVVFSSKCLSVIKFTVPPLHDPATHAFFAKSISESGVINYSYSPLLHSIIAIINQITKYPIPKLIILLNGIFLTLIPLNIYLLVKKIYRNKIFAILSFISISISPSPNNLFYTAGKNAFIFALLLSIISFWYQSKFLKKNKKSDLVKLVLSLILLFFCHYPMFAITIMIIIPSVIINFKKFFNKKIIFISILSVVVSSVIIFSWYQNRSIPKEAIIPNSSVEMSQLSQTQQIEKIIKGFDESVNLIAGNSHIEKSIFLITILIVSIIITQKSISMSLFVVGMYVSWIILVIIKTITKSFIVHDTFIIFATPVIYLLYAFCFSTLIKKQKENKLVFLLITMVFIFKQIETGINYRKIEYQLDQVSTFDLQAFDFISENINNSIILSANEIQQNENERVVFATDSALWLPIYTNSQIATPFWDFGSNKSYEIAKITQDIIREKKDDSVMVNKLKEMGIYYVYLDKGIFGAGLRKEYFNKVNYQSIYQNNEVEIIKL